MAQLEAYRAAADQFIASFPRDKRLSDSTQGAWRDFESLQMLLQERSATVKAIVLRPFLDTKGWWKKFATLSHTTEWNTRIETYYSELVPFDLTSQEVAPRITSIAKSVGLLSLFMYSQGQYSHLLNFQTQEGINAWWQRVGDMAANLQLTLKYNVEAQLTLSPSYYIQLVRTGARGSPYTGILDAYRFEIGNYLIYHRDDKAIYRITSKVMSMLDGGEHNGDARPDMTVIPSFAQVFIAVTGEFENEPQRRGYAKGDENLTKGRISLSQKYGGFKVYVEREQYGLDTQLVEHSRSFQLRETKGQCWLIDGARVGEYITEISEGRVALEYVLSVKIPRYSGWETFRYSDVIDRALPNLKWIDGAYDERQYSAIAKELGEAWPWDGMDAHDVVGRRRTIPWLWWILKTEKDEVSVRSSEVYKWLRTHTALAAAYYRKHQRPVAADMDDFLRKWEVKTTGAIPTWGGAEGEGDGRIATLFGKTFKELYSNVVPSLEREYDDPHFKVHEQWALNAMAMVLHARGYSALLWRLYSNNADGDIDAIPGGIDANYTNYVFPPIPDKSGAVSSKEWFGGQDGAPRNKVEQLLSGMTFEEEVFAMFFFVAESVDFKDRANRVTQMSTMSTWFKDLVTKNVTPPISSIWLAAPYENVTTQGQPFLKRGAATQKWGFLDTSLGLNVGTKGVLLNTSLCLNSIIPNPTSHFLVKHTFVVGAPSGYGSEVFDPRNARDKTKFHADAVDQQNRVHILAWALPGSYSYADLRRQDAVQYWGTFDLDKIPYRIVTGVRPPNSEEFPGGRFFRHHQFGADLHNVNGRRIRMNHTYEGYNTDRHHYDGLCFLGTARYYDPITKQHSLEVVGNSHLSKVKRDYADLFSRDIGSTDDKM